MLSIGGTPWLAPAGAVVATVLGIARLTAPERRTAAADPATATMSENA